MVTDLKSREGLQSSIYKEKITADRVKNFADAVGSHLGAWVAPPTFMTCFRAGEFEIIASLGLKLENALHAEQGYQYFSDFLPNTEVEFQSTLTHVLEKKGGSGRLCFLTVETQVHTQVDSTKRHLGSSSSTIVVREKA